MDKSQSQIFQQGFKHFSIDELKTGPRFLLVSEMPLIIAIDLFTDTAAILNSIVSNSYYGMLRGQISMYLPPEHPIIGI